MSEEKAVAVRPPSSTALEIPSYIPISREGTENIGRDDMIIPRIGLCQMQTPQKSKSNQNYIAGLTDGMLFNSMTGEILDRPLELIPIRYLGRRGIQFRPLDEGGGVIDMNVSLNDPRMQWGNTGDKKKDKPVATEFFEFLVILRETLDPIVLSFKSTGIKVGKRLNSFIKNRKTPIWSGVYKLDSVEVPGASGMPPYQVFTVENAGLILENEVQIFRSAFQQFANLDVKVDRSGEEGELIDDFPGREPGSDDM